MSEADPAIGAAADTAWTLGPIVDADAHVEPPFEMWKEYLPTALRDLAPVLEEGDEFDCVMFEGNRRPLRQLNNTAGRSGEEFKFNVKRSEMRPVWLPETRLADMDADGIDQAVIFGGGPLGTFNTDLYLASYEAYNRWLMDWTRADSRRLAPVGYVPMRDIDETVAQVRMLAGLGYKVINIPAFPQNPEAWKTTSGVAALKDGQVSALTGDPRGALQYWQPEFDKLWRTVVELDMVLTIHLGARVPRFGDKHHFLPDMPMSKMGMAEPISIFIFNGVFDRFPDLKIASVESGVGWMAWLAEYNDRTWEKQRFWTESPLRNPPSYYMDQNVYGVFLQDRTGIALRHAPGGRNIMWASDYPHSETTFPRSRAVILRDCAGVPENEIRDIVCNRARTFYRLA